jgi:2'-5' RNA ligase
MLRLKKQTLKSVQSDFSDWHRGRREFAIWMIELEQDEVLRKVEAARKHLSSFLLTPYHRQPHITLFVAGFLADERRHADDYTRHQLEGHCRMIADSNIMPFPIVIQGMDSFASAPFLKVRDQEEGIERVRTLLSSTATEIEREGFVPHVTVGLYSGIFESRVVLERIDAFRDEPLRLSIDRITFAAYESSELCGPLVYKKQVRLGKM